MPPLNRNNLFAQFGRSAYASRTTCPETAVKGIIKARAQVAGA
jgi:hypothetical protein